MPRVSLEGSSLSGIGSGRGQVVKRTVVGSSVCVARKICVLSLAGHVPKNTRVRTINYCMTRYFSRKKFF